VTADAPALVVEGLRHAYDGQAVLEVPSFTLPRGGYALVLGPSGCGKSTLLSIVAGLLPLQQGDVTVAGTGLGPLAARGARAVDRFRAQQVGLVPQQPMLFSVLDALRNVMAAQHFAGRPTDAAAAGALLRELGLDGLAGRRPAELSRGQQQRVAIARALVNRPALILADEPTANLDDTHAARVLDLLEERTRAMGAALLIATHDARVRERCAHRLSLPAR
jgi:putative ABC transport system ATP-binding protein